MKHAIGCNSGTDALIIGLRALGVECGDEVITTSFTFFATAEAISNIGAVPVFVDIHPESFNIDVGQVAKRITSRTKAVVPVHLFGDAANMDELMALSEKTGIKILEDSAQAMGSSHRSRKVGSIGHLGAFSFFPSKNLGAFGDGGLMTTNDDQVARACRMLRVHGSEKRYFNEMFGYCSRLDEIQAAFLRVKLKRIEESNDGRRAVAQRYNALFADCSEIVTPLDSPNSKHVFHQYTLRVPAEKRDALAASLQESGIGTMIYYPVPLHRLPVYQSAEHQPLPHTEKAAREVISLPIWPTLAAENQQEIASALKSCLAKL